MDRTYICIDLKSFYASVECRERGLDPLNTNLVVADKSRTEKTICLAVSPSLKQYGIPGRARLFEIIQKVKEINCLRRYRAQNHKFSGKSYLNDELKNNKNLELDYVVAVPQMGKYIKCSTEIYNIYLKYLAPEDIYVYSIDEVFCDITNYLKLYNMTARELVSKMIKDVYDKTGITATAGIGTNLFLGKIAMDIVAKHCEPNEIGVRIAELDKKSYREQLWNHTPITDFWRVGRGYATKLEKYRIFTMGDVARCSVKNEELLYKLFGINAELLIDHAWGYEPCTLKDVKGYKPSTNSLCVGQVLHCAYDYKKTKLVIKEMADLLSLDLVDKKVVTNQLTLTLGYDAMNQPSFVGKEYDGEITIDRFGRKVPKHSHGTINLDELTSSTKNIVEAIIKLYDRIVNSNLLIKRINISANNLVNELSVKDKKVYEQIDMFTNYKDIEKKEEQIKKDNEDEKKLQQAMLEIKKKYGKNAILKGMNFEEGGTTISRNSQIGGHRE